jgi:hypothetical protein
MPSGESMQPQKKYFFYYLGYIYTKYFFNEKQNFGFVVKIQVIRLKYDYLSLSKTP